MSWTLKNKYNNKVACASCKDADQPGHQPCLSVFTAGNKLEGDVGDIISLQAQTSPYFQLRYRTYRQK